MASYPYCLRFSSALKIFSSTYIASQHNVGTLKHLALFKSTIFDKQKLPLHHLPYRYMAGHAKWQNIKHVKEAKDRQKSLLCNKYVRMVISAIREKGPDPKSNNKLASILEEAKKNNIPSSTLDNALKRASNKKLTTGSLEMLGPGGCIVIFEYETDNIGEMRRSIKVICRKYSAGIFPATSERWRAAYDQKGIVRVTKQLNGESLDNEKMLDAAIEAGAEDVQKVEEENYYEFLCAPDDIHLVKKELELKFVVEEAFVGYLPTVTVNPSDEDKTLALSFLNELAGLPDVTRLYENIE